MAMYLVKHRDFTFTYYFIIITIFLTQFEVGENFAEVSSNISFTPP